MSIKTLVEDARFLQTNGRPLGALTILMLAIAGSSRKLFPKGIAKSIRYPKDFMRDEECFCLFLGGRLNKIFCGDLGGPDAAECNIVLKFKGKDITLAEVLYKYYRNGLIHQAELPNDVEFTPVKKTGSDNHGASISLGDVLVLDHGWIDILIDVVVNAKCNYEIFDTYQPELKANHGIIPEEHLAFTVEKFNITPICYKLLRHGLGFILDAYGSKEAVPDMSESFSRLFDGRKLRVAGISALHGFGLTDKRGKLTSKGIAVINTINECYHI
ncbi:hypothetical protein [Enterobacter cloacae]|uniref:hypothetical protein n=1 Tax=Enterobacter cloacae TaxID=550 RepID=UPI0029C0E75B|nr:hypothetical protein [Enterobacter cloacae]